ncbi:TonB family C-terminal domain-containing protein [Stigmatella aurantiaca]|uniref:TonB family C-terminal domain-containing protein n=1 Tax=Stigmatella aurantiaca TaxID=41 RepID=A0A1H7Y164_STIAU|nr:TonB family C-terminal domain-containing protein [Stigmatella aurantiaca]
MCVPPRPRGALPERGRRGGRAVPGAWARLCAVLLVLQAGTAFAQGLDGGSPDAGAPTEVEVRRTEAGFALEAGDAGTEPVFLPPSLLADSPAQYPPELAAEQVTGTVRLELLVDEAGEVESATLVEGSHPLLNEAALHAAPGLRFVPATLDGGPVPVRIGFEYRFEAPRLEEGPPGDGGVALGPVTLKGLVRAKGNRRPLPGAVLVSEAAPDAPVETDAAGRFEARWPPGTQWVRVTSPGHKPLSFRENVRPGETLEVVYGLEPLVLNPYETVVRGDRERTEVSRVTLHDAELREVPGTLGDPFRVVMLLPGVGSMLSGVAYPVVRGSQPSSTGYFLDGVRVPILFHLFLGPAVLHPDFIDTIDFYPGTPPPQYGRLMGGAINGRLSRPRDDRVHGSVYADFINAGFFIEYPFQSTGTNVSVAGRYSYTPWIVAIAANAIQEPPPPGRKNDKLVLDFWDYQARVEQKVGRGQTRLFAFGSSDTFGEEAQDALGSTSLQTILFHRVDLRHQHPVGPGQLEAGVTWGLDRLGLVSRDPDERTEFHIDNLTFSARTRYDMKVSERLSLRAGADLDHTRANVQAFFPDEEEDGSTRDRVINAPVSLGLFTGAYAELVWQPEARWTVVPGLRVDNYHLSPGINRFAVEPRLSVRHALREDLTLKAGAGLFHQAPTTLISLPVVDVAGLEYGLQQGLQFSLGAEWRGWKAFEVGLDVYLNPMLRTVELTPFSGDSFDEDDIGDPVDDDDDVGRPTLPDLTRHGLAYGLELLIRRPLGGAWFGWLSYTLQRSTRYTRFTRHDARGNELGQVEKNLPFVFDQTHILNLVVSRKFGSNWTLGGVLHFNTGRPEAGQLGSQTQREGIVDGRPGWVEVDRDQVDRLPAFFRFDIRVSRSWAYETFTLEAYLDMLNVAIRKEVVGFDYLGGFGRPLVKESIGVPVVLPILGVKGRY